MTPPRATLPVGDSPVRGPGSAPITLIEFADFECPYCQQMVPDLKKVEEEFKGKLAFVYKDFPLPMHPRAQKAAEAAHCAGDQNKYWEYHDFLLASKQLEVPQLKTAAQSIGLDSAAFDKCLDSGQRAGAVQAAFNQGLQLGISGTPSFLLNGRFINGVMPYEQLRALLEEELRKAPATSDQAAGR